mgnify:CR=1 FL=1
MRAQRATALQRVSVAGSTSHRPPAIEASERSSLGDVAVASTGRRSWPRLHHGEIPIQRKTLEGRVAALDVVLPQELERDKQEGTWARQTYPWLGSERVLGRVCVTQMVH